MPEKAIVVYLDDSSKMQQELSWLYKTWILYSLESEYDLVVYHNPSAKNKLKNFSNIIPVEMSPIRMSNNYKFLNSHYFCTNPYNEILKKYKYILKTDCDVFLTKNIKNFTPSSFMVGQGGYYIQSDSSKIEFIKNISKNLKLNYNHMPSIGSSFFGKTDEILPIVSLQSQITEYLLNNYFKNNNKTDELSGFNIGIASMIAGEVAINHVFNNQHVTLYCLDSKCWETSKIGNDVLHIHAWHTDQKWSKHQYFNGEYKDWNVEFTEAFDNAANYFY